MSGGLWKGYRKGPKSQTIEDRFWRLVLMVENCWEWIGRTTTTGYGMFKAGGKDVIAHRYSYELRHGKIPDGLTIDHLCRNRRCVNPEHLEAVSLRENILRGTNSSGLPHAGHMCRCGKTKTIRSNGWYRCTPCDTESKRLWREARAK